MCASGKLHRIGTRKVGLCIRHGGGKMCKIDGCTRTAEGQAGLCIFHSDLAPQVKQIAENQTNVMSESKVTQLVPESDEIDMMPESNKIEMETESDESDIKKMSENDVAIMNESDDEIMSESDEIGTMSESEGGLMSENEEKEMVPEVSGQYDSEVNIESKQLEMIQERNGEEGQLFLMRGGLGLTEPPKIEEWERAKEIHLMDNELSELPQNPRCPILSKLFLTRNIKLRRIPESFFRQMPSLQVLNLSRTRIKSLPDSLFGLINLKRLFINKCELLMTLSTKVGQLKNLEVLDLEGTEIMDLPEEVKNLVNLKFLEVSFYGYMNHGGRSERTNTLIPLGAISSLSHLEELKIDVSPEDKKWDSCVEPVFNEVCNLTRLSALKFYFPRIELFRNCSWFNATIISPSLLEFRFIVGCQAQRIMTRLPCDVEFELERWDRCLKYVNGVGVPTELQRVLQHATAFFLDRHTTVMKLSSFGIDNMQQLKCCVLGECNELQMIMDGEDVYESNFLGSLEYLYIFRMKSFTSIWEGSMPNEAKCLSHLKFLTLCTCPQLTAAFSEELLDSLNNLEELTVEDCPAITSLVSHQSTEEQKASRCFLPRLRKISLNYVPVLVSISSGFSIAPRLEWLSIYGCPTLKSLSIEDVSSNYLKMIKGEQHWWDALEWSSNRPAYLDDFFVPIDT